MGWFHWSVLKVRVYIINVMSVWRGRAIILCIKCCPWRLMGLPASVPSRSAWLLFLVVLWHFWVLSGWFGRSSPQLSVRWYRVGPVWPALSVWLVGYSWSAWASWENTSVRSIWKSKSVRASLSVRKHLTNL